MLNRSQRITLRDVRAIWETVGECREAWADPSTWQAHLMRRAATLGGCRIGLYFEMADHGGVTADRAVAAHDVGWESDGERQTVVEALAKRPLRYSPLWAAFADRLGDRGRGGGVLTLPQDRFITTGAWQASDMYDRHVRPTRLGRVVLSAAWVPHLDVWSAWSLVTDRGDPVQTPRQQRLVRLLHGHVAPLIGIALSTWRDRTTDTISATRRAVLAALLNGQSEPQVAKAMFRSRSAVHEHVTAIYRHFGVRGRNELMAFFLHRRPVPAGRAARPSLDGWLDRAWVA